MKAPDLKPNDEITITFKARVIAVDVDFTKKEAFGVGYDIYIPDLLKFVYVYQNNPKYKIEKVK